MTVLVTGGAGFIGSNFILQWIGKVAEQLVNLGRRTYAGNVHNLAGQRTIHGMFLCIVKLGIFRPYGQLFRSNSNVATIRDLK